MTMQSLTCLPLRGEVYFWVDTGTASTYRICDRNEVVPISGPRPKRLAASTACLSDCSLWGMPVDTKEF